MGVGLVWVFRTPTTNTLLHTWGARHRRWDSGHQRWGVLSLVAARRRNGKGTAPHLHTPCNTSRQNASDNRTKHGTQGHPSGAKQGQTKDRGSKDTRHRTNTHTPNRCRHENPLQAHDQTQAHTRIGPLQNGSWAPISLGMDAWSRCAHSTRHPRVPCLALWDFGISVITTGTRLSSPLLLLVLDLNTIHACLPLPQYRAGVRPVPWRGQRGGHLAGAVVRWSRPCS